MADNTQNIQSQTTPQSGQSIERPVREFIQVDTSSNAYMEKSEPKAIPLSTE